MCPGSQQWEGTTAMQDTAAHPTSAGHSGRMSAAVLALSRRSGHTRPAASSGEATGSSSGRRAGAGPEGSRGDGRQSQGAHAGREREARSLQPTVSLDTPSEASAAERQFLERMLEQEGAGRLHALPDFQGSYAAGPSSHPSLPKERWPWTAAASGSVPWNVAAETPMGGAAAGRKGGGQAAEPQPGVTIRGVAGLAGMQEEGSSSESKVPGTRTPSGIECNDEHGSSAAAGGAAVERQLNSISLSELYLGDRFASGTYGRLYTGVFRGQTVAIKILRSPESEQAASQMADLFSREVTMLAQLSHPNIVQFMGACQKPPLHCLVTELLPGGTLRKYLSGLTAPPPFTVALRMALDVARGMGYLHSRNIIHRDLKADNLVLSRSHVVKLTDFGSARVESEEGAQMTAETGTFKFMAPEVIRRRAYSRKVDVYSFGILLWELFTAEVAFAGMSGVQAAFAVVNKGLRPRLPPGLPPPLRGLLRSCWHPSPDRRPDFPAIVRLLDALRTGGPVSSAAPLRARRRRLPFRLATACFRGEDTEEDAATQEGHDTTSSDSTPSERPSEAFFQRRRGRDGKP